MYLSIICQSSMPFNVLHACAYSPCKSPDPAAAGGSLPPLNPHQANKLKQLTLVSLALNVKVGRPAKFGSFCGKITMVTYR